MYCYIDALKDVTTTVLSYFGCSEAIAITLHCDMPGTEHRRLIENNLDVLDMFYVQGMSKTINLYVDISHSIRMEDGGDRNKIGDGNGGDGNNGGDGVHTVDVDEEYHEDNVYMFSDEDRDWNATVNEINISDGTESLSDEDNEELNENDDDVLSDYRSGDDEVRYFSSDDEFDGEVDWMDDEEMTGFKIVRDQNEKVRVTAHCAAEGCPWRIRSSPLPDRITYKIKTLVANHTCSRMNQNNETTSTSIANKLVNNFKDNPHMGLDTMQVKLNKLFGIEASRMQLYRAKRRCKEELEGDHGSQYVLQPTYAEEIKKTNPGNLAVINYDLPLTPISENGEEPDPIP
ncbi:hypothetical protein ACSBR2_001992 [Camellia fascicularis]